jgi:hypothetical protein
VLSLVLHRPRRSRRRGPDQLRFRRRYRQDHRHENPSYDTLTFALPPAAEHIDGQALKIPALQEPLSRYRTALFTEEMKAKRSHSSLELHRQSKA